MSSTQITRSRTAKQKLASSRQQFLNAFSHLREIELQQPATTADAQPTPSAISPPAQKKRGRPATKKQKTTVDADELPSSSTEPAARPKKKSARPIATKSKTKRGQRLLPIGGSELQSTISVGASAEKRSVGQTCQPKTSDSSVQVIRCEKCGDLSHSSIICTGETATPKPPPLFCNRCKLTFKYTSSTEMETKIQLCSAHRLVAEQSTERKRKAEALITKVNKLTGSGMSLPDALKLLGLNEQKYNKLRMIFDM